MQKFREDLLMFQFDSKIHLEKAFFEFYNAFHSKLNNSISQPYTEIVESFTRACSTFPIYTLESNAARRLINICDDIKRQLKKILSFPLKVMSAYYPNMETMNTETLQEMIAQDYFQDMRRHLEFVVPIYNQNRECVIPLLESFMEIYRKPIDDLIKMNGNMIKMIRRGLKKDMKFIGHSFATLDGISYKIKKCAKTIDTFGCLGSFLDYDCTKGKSGCGPVYRSIHVVFNHLKHILSYYDYYEVELDNVQKVIHLTDEELIKWSNKLDECILDTDDWSKLEPK